MVAQSSRKGEKANEEKSKEPRRKESCVSVHPILPQMMWNGASVNNVVCDHLAGASGRALEIGPGSREIPASPECSEPYPY